MHIPRVCTAWPTWQYMLSSAYQRLERWSREKLGINPDLARNIAGTWPNPQRARAPASDDKLFCHVSTQSDGRRMLSNRCISSTQKKSCSSPKKEKTHYPSSNRIFLMAFISNAGTSKGRSCRVAFRCQPFAIAERPGTRRSPEAADELRCDI